MKEVAEIKKRIAIDPDGKEVTKLRAVIEEFASHHSSTYNEILRIATLAEPKPEMVQKHSAHERGPIQGKQAKRENSVDRER